MVFFIKNGIEFSTINEGRGLINMARNRSAMHALKHGYNKLLFIDADISWRPEHVAMLLNSPHRVVGGVYPLKAFPVKFNMVPKQGIYDTPTYNPWQYAKDFMDPETKEVEVHSIPTGFLMIDTSIFTDLDPHVESYVHREQLGETQHEKMYFPFGIDDDRHILTEDWGFCKLVREKLGEKIYWHTQVIVDHVGRHVYSLITPINEATKQININKEDVQIVKKSDLVPNPFNKWPRNLPCFCGSGKKFKKCHDGNFSEPVTPEEAEKLKPDFDRILAVVQTNHDKGIGYRLGNPAL